jgi:membrane protein
MARGGTSRVNETARFLKTGIWKVRLRDYRGLRRVLIKYLRILLIAGEQFVRDRCMLWASSLTYYSILSVVPVFALGFAVAKGFGLQKYLENLVVEQFRGEEGVAMAVLEYSRNVLVDANGSVIVGVGAIMLILTVFQLLAGMEQAFNSIWDVHKGRSLGRQLSDYLSIMLVSPVLITASSSVMVLLATRVGELLARLGFGLFAPVITLALSITPYILIWLLLTFVYVFLPNTRVRLVSGMAGGVIAGTVFVLVQWFYIRFQVGVASYNAIYGSLAAVPLFLVWMFISWIIVLVGIEIVYAHQNQEHYVYEHVVGRVSPSFRLLMSLQVMHRLVANFRDGGHPLRVSRISGDLEIPRMLVVEILDTLVAAELAAVCPAKGPGRKAYQPALDIDLITIAYVVETLGNTGVCDIPVARTESLELFSSSLKTFAGLMERSDANLLLKEI